jgi:asparagine synthase (glutamine-hydrolysing)
LRKELINKGHQFKSNTDTEVLIHLYEEEQEQMLQKINGMFGFAIWDTRRKRMLLARDRIGKKPLYYWQEHGRLIFASELKSILAVSDIPKEIDPIAIDEYLTYQYIPHPRTIWLGTSKLSPAHYAIWENDNLTVTRYWNPDLNFQDNNLTINEWSEELRFLLTDAVKIRLRSDVPLGAFLSGGIDSSIISGIMQHENTQQVRTFSIGFQQKEYDETYYAKQAANKFGTLHHTFIVTPNIHDILPKLIYHYDEPHSDSSDIPTWYLCEYARREVTVALSGDGGDEMFAGYDRHRAVHFAEYIDNIPVFLRRFLAGPIQKMIPASTSQSAILRRFKRFLEAIATEPLERSLLWAAYFNRRQRNELYTNNFVHNLNGYDSIDFLLKAEKLCLQRDMTSRICLIDMQTYLPCAVLNKVDIASMAHALECRSPFLDYRIAELSARMPIRFKICGNTGKVILRKTFADLLPTDIGKRGKMGFGVPIDHWFRNELKDMVHDILLDTKTIQRGFFQRNYIEKMLKEHILNKIDHSRRLWSLLVLELWMRQWLD